MKNYEVHVEVRIQTTENYTTVYPMKFSFTETLPVNADVDKYIRNRLNTELQRAIRNMKELDNFSEDYKKVEVDPLTGYADEGLF